jgi:hypothetical protein
MREQANVVGEKPSSRRMRRGRPGGTSVRVTREKNYSICNQGCVVLKSGPVVQPTLHINVDYSEQLFSKVLN